MLNPTSYYRMLNKTETHEQSRLSRIIQTAKELYKEYQRAQELYEQSINETEMFRQEDLTLNNSQRF